MTDRGKAIEIIQKSGVLNPKLTLGEIMEVAGRLEGVDIDPLAAWTLIGPNWVYKGDDKIATE